jgi:hypothetical protein
LEYIRHQMLLPMSMEMSHKADLMGPGKLLLHMVVVLNLLLYRQFLAKPVAWRKAA